MKACMKDMILASGWAGTFGSVAAILAYFPGHPTHDAVVALAKLGDSPKDRLWGH